MIDNRQAWTVFPVTATLLRKGRLHFQFGYVMCICYSYNSIVTLAIKALCPTYLPCTNGTLMEGWPAFVCWPLVSLLIHSLFKARSLFLFTPHCHSLFLKSAILVMCLAPCSLINTTEPFWCFISFLLLFLISIYSTCLSEWIIIWTCEGFSEYFLPVWLWL